jgi:hypothetical protein
MDKFGINVVQHPIRIKKNIQIQSTYIQSIVQIQSKDINLSHALYHLHHIQQLEVQLHKDVDCKPAFVFAFLAFNQGVISAQCVNQTNLS